MSMPCKRNDYSKEGSGDEGNELSFTFDLTSDTNPSDNDDPLGLGTIGKEHRWVIISTEFCMSIHVFCMYHSVWATVWQLMSIKRVFKLKFFNKMIGIKSLSFPIPAMRELSSFRVFYPKIKMLFIINGYIY